MQRLERWVSPARLARALGLGESTLKRWIDQGRIPAAKTPGGHRRIRLAEVLHLLQGGGVPQAELAALGLTDRDEVSSRALAAVLGSESPERALTILEGLYAAGVRAAELADRWIAPAMQRVGRGWEAGRVTITAEHRATAVMLRALYGLLRAQPVPSARAPDAVVAGLAGDPYLLAPLCVQLVLCESGLRATNFGPDTPATSLCDAITERRPAVVALSVSVPGTGGHDARVALAAACREAGSRLFVGGRGLVPDLLHDLAGAIGCRSLSEMERILRRPARVRTARSA